MAEMDDPIQMLLKTGSFKTSRARSPNPYSNDLPTRARQLPRSDANINIPRSYDQALPLKRPPPPVVEDEAESLAKEHGSFAVSDSENDEEPKYRGDVDQHPIILPNPQHNPERRFVILTGSETGDDEDGRASLGSGHGRSSTPTEKYEANTCRKYVIVASSEPAKEDKEIKKPRGLSKRKSHQDLPPLDTDLRPPEPSITRSSSRRHREKVLVDQEPREDRDRSAKVRPPPPPPADESLTSSPTITHSTKGRDRAYWDINPGAKETSRRRSPTRAETRTAKSGDRRTSDERRSNYSSSNQSSGASAPTRAASNADPLRNESRASAKPAPYVDPLVEPLVSAYTHNDPSDALAFMLQGSAPPGRKERDDRNSNSPPYPRSRERNISRSPSLSGQRRSGFREQDEYYDDYGNKYHRSSRSDRRRQRRSTIDPEPSSLLSPDQARASGKSKSKGTSPLPSPRAERAAQFPDVAPRSPRSATFPPTERESKQSAERPMSPPTPLATSPPRRRTDDGGRGTQPRAESRTASINSFSNSSRALPIPVPIPVDRSNASERRASPVSSPTLGMQESRDTGSAESSWEPGSFDPVEHGASLNLPITSIRRYSESVESGLLPQLPECSWTVPALPGSKPGGNQFMKLPRVDNFLICPDCYAAEFANSSFKHMFVPAPARPADQPISCDFGSSHWYRIAYLMTLNYGYKDLHLLQEIASVAARHQSCAGGLPATRVWYSMMDPHAKRPISTFNVCRACARTVEVLLPSLAGVFVPLDTPAEPVRGVCELHFAPGRKRFLDYFDMLEVAFDQAFRSRTAPNVQELANNIRNVSLHDECQRNTPCVNRRWHVMQSLPEFTVCEECFDSVVWPLLEADEGGEIPRNFFKNRQSRPVAACQLYSERMREVFRKACYDDDFFYLEAKVLERLKAEADIKARYVELQKQDQSDPRVQRERLRLAKELKNIE
ncbi:hypothetical protein B0T22DRAFT_210450 [Podospora appendiculata]|uniref:Ser/arg-related nuclear matrix protein n=1 Tax=Podospora appendiculata TaxID=314037 RepID=A0AAE1CA26_9PEZI|nr:hypothetical protein B0T22DRAFT_210450 [Podospora appendiculata]